MPVEIVAVIFPKADKVDRVVELLSNHAKWVQANEPNTLKYELKREINKKTGADELVVIESYVDMEAVKVHGGAKEFQAFGQIVKDEDLVAAPMQIRFLTHVAGFSRL